MQSIAFFDVDDTLISGNSGFYTSLHLVRHRIMKRRRLLQAIYYLMTSLVFNHDVKKIYQIAIRDLAGCTLDRVLEIGKECFERDVKPRLYVGGIEKLREHQAKGDGVVLLTSAPYMLIRILQDYLGVTEAYCMGPVIRDGILTNTLCLPICHAEGKVHYAKQASQKFGVSLKDCYFYTDHPTDVPLLKLVGNPRVVNPGRQFKKMADKRRWPTLFFKETLGQRVEA